MKFKSNHTRHGSAPVSVLHNKYQAVLHNIKLPLLAGLCFASLLKSNDSNAEYGLNFPEPAANVAQDIYNIHMLTMQITTVLLLIVFRICFLLALLSSQEPWLSSRPKFPQLLVW